MKKIFLKLFQLYFRLFRPSGKAKSLIMWPIATRVLGSSFEETIELKNGLKIRSDMSDTLTRSILFYGPWVKYPLWEPVTLDLVKRLLQKDQNIIVAGAHIGYVPLSIISKATGGISLHIFEPVSSFFRLVSENIRLNNSRNIEANKVALSDRVGTATLYVQNIRSSLSPTESSAMIETVTTTTIDAYVNQKKIERVDLMLIDVEGFEPQVFAGMTEVFKRGDRPDIFFEVSPRIIKDKDVALDLIKNLNSLGYSSYIIDDLYENPMDYKFPEKIQIFPLDSNFQRFWSLRNFNVFATQRDENNLEGLKIGLQS